MKKLNCNPEEVRDFKAANPSVTHIELAEMFGVSRSSIYRILKGERSAGKSKDNAPETPAQVLAPTLALVGNTVPEDTTRILDHIKPRDILQYLYDIGYRVEGRVFVMHEVNIRQFAHR